MAHRHQVDSSEVGQVRIYLEQGEKCVGNRKGLKKWLTGAPLLYREIIKAAKKDGLLNATAHHTHYGFSGAGHLQSDNFEVPNKSLNLYVELVGPREQLELFCRTHGSLLKGKVVLYKHIEHWEISARRLHTSEADFTEYAEPETVITDEREQ